MLLYANTNVRKPFKMFCSTIMQPKKVRGLFQEVIHFKTWDPQEETTEVKANGFQWYFECFYNRYFKLILYQFQIFILESLDIPLDFRKLMVSKFSLLLSIKTQKSFNNHNQLINKSLKVDTFAEKLYEKFVVDKLSEWDAMDESVVGSGVDERRRREVKIGSIIFISLFHDIKTGS